jgi:hypothetical protein
MVQHDKGGRGSNYTKKRVLEESTLVEIFRSCHHNIECNLDISGMTQRHGAPDFTATYTVLAHYFRTHSPNEHRNGRKSAYLIPDMIDRGLNNIECATDTQEVERQADAEDLEVELL